MPTTTLPQAVVRWAAAPFRSRARDWRYDTYAVLQDARSIVERGWVQNQWYVHRTPPPPLLRLILGPARPADPDDVRAACLVGAVFHAVRRRGALDDLMAAGPVLDLL